MKRWFLILFVVLLSLPGISQTYLGVFEAGDTVPFMVIAADPLTGEPTNPVDLSYHILRNGSSLSSGTMSIVQLGVATGEYSSLTDPAGSYSILISGRIGDVTAQTYKTYTLVEAGKGLTSIADEVGGINGITPLSETVFLPHKVDIISSVTQEISTDVQSASESLSQRIQGVEQETKIGSREHNRARLWYAQSTIDTATRQVPADLPSHLEVQVAAPDDIEFATPLETFFRIYYYPNATTATKSSREVRSATPPMDGTFYLVPDQPW